MLAPIVHIQTTIRCSSVWNLDMAPKACLIWLEPKWVLFILIFLWYRNWHAENIVKYNTKVSLNLMYLISHWENVYKWPQKVLAESSWGQSVQVCVHFWVLSIVARKWMTSLNLSWSQNLSSPATTACTTVILDHGGSKITSAAQFSRFEFFTKSEEIDPFFVLK